MRNISQLALGLVLLVSQANVPELALTNVAAAEGSQSQAAGVYEVKLNTNTADATDAIEIDGPQTPDYDAEVLGPLHAAQAAAAAVKPTRKRRTYPVLVAKLVPGSHADWMRAAGIAESDFGYVNYIVDHESGWACTKWNRAGSGAYGLGQALPATKMAAFGSDYMTDPITQLRWANAYAVGRYGSWANAYSHWLRYHNW